MNLGRTIHDALIPHVSELTAESLVRRHVRDSEGKTTSLAKTDREHLAERIVAAAALFSDSELVAIRRDVRSALGLDAS